MIDRQVRIIEVIARIAVHAKPIHSSKRASIRSTNASLSARLNGLRMLRTTSGSALRRAKGSRSDSRQRRRMRRGVVSANAEVPGMRFRRPSPSGSQRPAAARMARSSGSCSA